MPSGWWQPAQWSRKSLLGLAPADRGTGGEVTIGKLPKGRDRYVRQLLIHGARSVVSTAHGREDRLSRWVTELKDRSHINVAAVALANKTVRVAWAMLRNGTDYEPEFAVA